ncbi:DNA helicase RecQ [bacterium SCSIO 12741]|nr:DNA helicase RecQ [bacterium SCSIO 12741]
MLTTLKQHFGYSEFRPLQKEIIENVMDGKDTVVLMPTGGGKSICYQLPALLMDGLTLVVSPLIALMKDQVNALQANGIAAEYLNSSLDETEERAIVDRLMNQELKLLYVSPEKIFSANFLDFLQQLPIRLIAIDEAHCVSSWGHHFRPEYRELKVLKETFTEVPVVALTATADRAVRADIGQLLGMESPSYFVASFDRPNLSLAVLPGRQKWEQTRRILRNFKNECGIIYCGSRKATEELSSKLKLAGFKAGHYHAGMKPDLRAQAQEDFIQGNLNIICATIAFGMGIDKSNVRFVIHQNMPGNLESYYQEIGRAGRDGLDSETYLFYSYRDVQTQMGFIEAIDNPQYREIQELKLQRMQEFAEAQVCRRKILLSYFSENPGEDCGNCDVCKNPPQYMDGTREAQMALSAVTRTGEQAGVTQLIDILKGTRSVAVLQNQWHQLRTFGVGQAVTAFAWQLFLQQLIQQGFLEIDYRDHNNLKLTELSREVLFENKKVRLVTPETIRERQKQPDKAPVLDEVEFLSSDERLFEALRTLRKSIAQKIGKPPFVVFSDASLKDMAARKPSDRDEFLEVSGVGEFKAKRYAEAFLEVIKTNQEAAQE